MWHWVWALGLGVKDAIQTDLGQCWYGQNEVGHIGLSRPPAVDSVYLSWYDGLVAFLTNHPVASQRPLTFETVLSGQVCLFVSVSQWYR